jgi:outer membrane protein OmpA-like peptidoglycan-associated protein
MNIIKMILLPVCALIILAGCETQNAYTGESKISRKALFGGIGAVVCGALGSRKDSQRARQAAAGCGLVGLGVGAYMDQQEAKLRRELVSSGVQVVREGENIRLVMPNSITFAINKSTLNRSIYATLNSVVNVLNEFDETNLQVAGHTDSSGAAAYNQSLSVSRATSVSDYLESRNIRSNRLFVVGYGESSPITSNASAVGRAENRRVELLIEPRV